MFLHKEIQKHSTLIRLVGIMIIFYFVNNQDQSLFININFKIQIASYVVYIVYNFFLSNKKKRLS